MAFLASSHVLAVCGGIGLPERLKAVWQSAIVNRPAKTENGFQTLKQPEPECAKPSSRALDAYKICAVLQSFKRANRNRRGKEKSNHPDDAKCRVNAPFCHKIVSRTKQNPPF